jgi:hypothetical protein
MAVAKTVATKILRVFNLSQLSERMNVSQKRYFTFLAPRVRMREQEFSTFTTQDQLRILVALNFVMTDSGVLCDIITRI